MDFAQKLAKDLFLKTIQQLRQPAILLHQKSDGLFETISVTEAFARMMECTMEQALQLMNDNGYLTSTHPEDRIFVRRMLRRHVNEEGGADLIIRKTTAKHNIIWCNVQYTFIDSFDSLYVYCTYFDITKLKEYEQRLHSAYTSLGENFYRPDEDTLGLFRVNLTSDRIEEMQGRELFASDSLVTPYSVVISKRAESLEDVEERERFIETFDPEELMVTYLKGHAQASLTVYSRRPDGQLRYVTLEANITRHPMKGDIIAFLAEREANQTKVQETLINCILQRQFDMVAWLSEGRYGVVIGDASRITQGSIFPSSRTGDYQTYLQSQVVPVLHGSDEEKQKMITDLLPETVAQKISVNSPYIVNIVVDVNGQTWHKRFDFYAVDSASRFCIVLKSDTTDIQREQIRINNQLKVALKQSEQASVAKTAFLSRMSHEIRTPMNAIIGLGTLALRDPDISPNLHEYLTKISSSAKYLLSLINDILDMSRIESGRMTLKNEEFSFSGLLDLVSTLVDGQCRERGLSYECVVLGKVDEYYIGDDTKLRQVLINILGNAVKFTNPGGSVSLTVEHQGSFDGQARLSFVIADTGIGMDKDYLPRLFEPFSQEDSSNTTKYGGSGLGLAITKNMIQLMNGDIAVDSEKGKGTRFTVNLSLQETNQIKTVRSLAIDAKDLRVLVIDDDSVSCKHAKAILEDIGVAAETCLTYDDALHTIALHHARCEDFNLILVDLRMPEKDGIEVTRDIRKLMGNDAAIIILTAYNWQDVEKEAKRAGVDSFMTKPLFASTVLSEFKAAMQRKKQEEEQEVPLADLKGRKVLLAEDVALNAEIMKELLDILEISVVHVENGALAVETFSQDTADFDAILMDVRMPVMDGLEASKAIRQLEDPLAEQIPIIAMTANAFDEDVQHSLAAGMNAHLTKPVDPEQLKQTLASLIARYDRARGR
ncbi:MAG: response regulator [Desulfovibrio sp.]|nr:response regulator [Desulfovibrio sp.]